VAAREGEKCSQYNQSSLGAPPSPRTCFCG
jgi:hypothetical protein